MLFMIQDFKKPRHRCTTLCPEHPQSSDILHKAWGQHYGQVAAASVDYRPIWQNNPESRVLKSQVKVCNGVAVGLSLAQDHNSLHCFSQVIVPKTKSQLTDILLNASLLARANTVPLITSLANDCGPVLKQMLFDIPKASNQNSKPSLCLKVTLH